MATVELMLGLTGVPGVAACANLNEPTTVIVSVEAGYRAAGFHTFAVSNTVASWGLG